MGRPGEDGERSEARADDEPRGTSGCTGRKAGRTEWRTLGGVSGPEGGSLGVADSPSISLLATFRPRAGSGGRAGAEDALADARVSPAGDAPGGHSSGSGPKRKSSSQTTKRVSRSQRGSVIRRRAQSSGSHHYEPRLGFPRPSMRASGSAPAASHPDGRRAHIGIDRLRAALLVSGATGGARRDRPSLAGRGSTSAATPRAAQLGGASPARGPGPGPRDRLGQLGPMGARRKHGRQARLPRHESGRGPQPGPEKHPRRARTHAPALVTVPPPLEDRLPRRGVRGSRGTAPIADQRPRRPERPSQVLRARLAGLQLEGQHENLVARPSRLIRPFTLDPTVGLRRNGTGRASARAAGSQALASTGKRAGRTEAPGVPRRTLRCPAPLPT